jgi:hypothetical protein
LTAEVLTSPSTPLDEFHYFLSLPAELRHKIYSFIFPHRTICIFCLGQTFRIERVRLLALNRQIFEECKDYLWTRLKFLSRNLSKIEMLPSVMGVAVSNIRHFQLDNTFTTVVASESEWPYMMLLMHEHFRSLSIFEYHTSFTDLQLPPQHTDRERWIREEMCTLARFGAFLVIRVPQLSFLVVKKPYTVQGITHLRIQVTEKAPKLENGDTLLNSRAIRHSATWDELDNMSIKHFEIDSKCPTSEMASYGLLPGDMHKIDTIGYHCSGYRIRGEWVPSVDSMILAARENMLNYERIVHESRQRKENNTQILLGEIAGLFPQSGLFAI